MLEETQEIKFENKMGINSPQNGSHVLTLSLLGYFWLIAYFPNNVRYFGTYVSKDPWDFMNYGAVRCDDLRFPGFSMVFRYQCKRPVIGQYVTIRNFDFTHPRSNPGKFFRMEINEIVILGKCEFILIWFYIFKKA